MMRLDYLTGYPIDVLAVPHVPGEDKWKFSFLIEDKEVRFFKTDSELQESDVAGKSILAVENSYDGSTKLTIGKLSKHPPHHPEDTIEIYIEPEGYSILHGDVEWFPNRVISSRVEDLVIPEDPEVVRLQEAVEESEALPLVVEAEEAENG